MDESLKDIKDEGKLAIWHRMLAMFLCHFRSPGQLLAAQLFPYHVHLTDRCSLAVSDHRRGIFSSNRWLK